MKAASSRAPILFVTGTDTGVGKTAVTAMLARLLSENGRTVHVCKPIETGCRRNEQGELEPTDARVLREAGGGRQSLEQVIHYRFEAPVAPSVAAASVAARIDREALVLHIEQQAIDCDLLLVIGTSGLVYPAAGLARAGKESGATVAEFNLEEGGVSAWVDHFIPGGAHETLPLLVPEV